MQQPNIILNTAGDGYWSSSAAAVEVVDIEVPYINGRSDFGELRVYFNVDTWDIETQGLIYTDSLFLKQLQEYLNAQGLAGDNVSYSEQGMQGRDYVSCDIGKPFLDSWSRKFNIGWAEFLKTFN
jgi:hypothetical protein